MSQKFYGYIYITLNQQTNKVYIGQKFGLPNHTKTYLGSGTRFNTSVQSHGKQFFKKRILGILEANTKEELKILLNEAETECIFFYRSYGADGINKDDIYGYNLTPTGGSTLGSKSSEEAIEKRRQALLGKPSSRKGCKVPQETINKGIETKKRNGYKPSEETRKKQSESAKKRSPFTEEHKQNLSNSHKGKKAWNKGIPRTKKQKQQHSIKMKGKKSWNKGLKASKESIEINRLSHIGLKQSAQTIEKRQKTWKENNSFKKAWETRRKNIKLKKIYLTQIAYIINNLNHG